MTEPRTNEQELSFFDSSETPDAASADASYFTEPELDDAVPITSPAPEAVGDTPRYSTKVGEGNAHERFPARTRAEAEAALEAIADYCYNCPISEHCPEDECAVYRQEAKALEMIEADHTEAGVEGLVSSGSSL